MIKLIVYGIIIYFIYRSYKYLKRLFASPKKGQTEFKKAETPKSRLNIKKEDIIDAEFEDLKEKDKDKEKKQ